MRALISKGVEHSELFKQVLSKHCMKSLEKIQEMEMKKTLYLYIAGTSIGAINACPASSYATPRIKHGRVQQKNL